MDQLSRRARPLVAGSLPAYIGEHFARGADRFHPVDRPDGYLGLCVAENGQMWDLLEPALSGPHVLESNVTGYDDMAGTARFRAAIAALFEQRLFHRPVSAQAVVTMAGAGAVLEALFHAIADPGEGVLVPTPSYAGFWPDLTLRDGLVIVPVHTSAADSFRLTPRLLDQAVASSPVPVRALLLTNPDNPLGKVASPSELHDLVAWARRTGVQLVVDEIYALSVFGHTPFTSIGSLGQLGEDVHVVWAFSKDFAMSGLRCGVLVTDNPDVRAAVAAQAVWGSVSTLTQAVLSAMLEDGSWTDRYIDTMRARLGGMHAAVIGALTAAGIRHLPAEAGFFLLVDLREFLDEPTWGAEDRLWRRLLDEANVNLTPGSACRVAEPGFFRLCYAALPVEHVLEGIDRMWSVVSGQWSVAEGRPIAGEP